MSYAKQDAFVSVVIVADVPLVGLAKCLVELLANLTTRYSDYEIVVISQGPVEASRDWREEDSLLEDTSCIRWIQLSGHVHPDVAWAAALENAIGDYVVMYDPHRDPLRSIWETVHLCQSGFDIVVGVAPQQKTTAYGVFRPLADSLLTAAGYSLPRNSTTLRCASRRTINAVTRTGRFHHQLYMRIQKTGFPQTTYDYELKNENTQHRTLVAGGRKLIRLLVFNSSVPLRWMSTLGLLGSLAAFIFASYSLAAHFIFGTIVEGWTTTILFMSILFLLQFVMLAFFGEYLGRLLDERSGQADYSVVFEKTSRRMVGGDRVNVASDSVPRAPQ